MNGSKKKNKEKSEIKRRTGEQFDFVLVNLIDLATELVNFISQLVK